MTKRTLLPSFVLFAVHFVLAALFVTSSLEADVKLPAMFTDHAVLQREMPVPVWGWADPGEEITVAIAGQTHKTKADDKGKWRVTLEPLAVGKPLKLVVEGKNRVAVNDILVGEVWLCSGQSNMEFPLVAAANGDLEIAAAQSFPQYSTGQGQRAGQPNAGGGFRRPMGRLLAENCRGLFGSRLLFWPRAE